MGDESTTEVVISNYAFPAMTTTPGAKLRFVNSDLEPHTVTANDGSFGLSRFNSNTPMVLVAPSTEGSFPFFCEIHPTMQGVLVVANS